MKFRPKKCPKCEKSHIAEIIYGMPAWNEKMEQHEKEGIIHIGGCCITDDDPLWYCNHCGHKWGHTR